MYLQSRRYFIIVILYYKTQFIIKDMLLNDNFNFKIKMNTKLPNFII